MKKRIEGILKELVCQNLDALLVSSVSNITYLTGFSNFSTLEREAFLLITRLPSPGTGGQAKVKQYIVTDGRYSEAVALHIPHFELIEQTVKNPLKEILKNLAKKHKIKKLGIEENNLTVSEYKVLKKNFNDIYHFSGISSLRAIKDQSELSAIEKACRLGDKAFEHILKRIKKGITEREVAFEIEHFIKKTGADISFPPIVAFGKNSSIPHHQTSDKRLTTSDKLILLDFGVKLNNYRSDMTRTAFFGKPTAKQKFMYRTVLEAQKKALETLYNRLVHYTSTIKAREIDTIARELIISKGYPSIPHSLGHGVGLEVHESPTLSPNSKDELKPGMVFSIEPGIYIPDFGGVRIEDLVVLEKSGLRLLTKSSRKIIQV